jgi:multidrug efflux pump subunit AcrA (membrane-fusion protein)
VSSKNRKHVKMLSAVIGGSALVAMGALSMAFGQEPTGTDTIAKSTMSVGATSTQTTPPTVEATSRAVPVMKGPAPLPSEQKAAE